MGRAGCHGGLARVVSFLISSGGMVAVGCPGAERPQNIIKVFLFLSLLKLLSGGAVLFILFLLVPACSCPFLPVPT